MYHGCERKLSWSKAKRIMKKIWYFIWEDDSIWSWIANIVLAFVLIRFVVYPVLGLLLATNYPIVAVVSGSMEHDTGFDAWWESSGAYYENNYGIAKEDFLKYKFRNGFNKGDIMILYGSKDENIDIGDVIVFVGTRKDPIIHRVVSKQESLNTTTYFTKGDHNPGPIQDDMNINEDRVLGEAMVRVPLLGWIKIAFVDLISLIR